MQSYDLLPDLVSAAADRRPDAPALAYRGESLSYSALAQAVAGMAGAVLELGLDRGERVAIYLEKRLETVVAMFGAAAAGCVFVPVNPLLRPPQVAHILRDCNVRILVTSAERLSTLRAVLADCPDLRHLVLVDADAAGIDPAGPPLLGWADALAAGAASGRRPHRVIDQDMAAILYTSGSTGRPKGVVLSHRNIVAGARSVSQYLENTPEDRILSVLPLSFDAGLSQLTTAFNVGASTILMNYLLPQDVVRMVAAERITGLAGVPPLWIQLSRVEWPEAARRSLRYITNTGGRMPRATLDRLRSLLPETQVFLMYGLTEAFRSTYLPPSEIDRRPDSIGKAIPNAEILVVRANGEPCDPDEPGELVHRGALVALGYWNDPEKTAERFRPAPNQPAGIPIPEMAVWSGDTVRRDADGFLYFVGRRDEMIKTSGYRVSPTEVEEVLYGSGLVGEVVVFGVDHPSLGQAIVVVATPPAAGALDRDAILQHCRRDMPPYMVPHVILEQTGLPRNPNGKLDRKMLSQQFADVFADAAQ